MTKPVALYYRILKYQPENLRRLQDAFEVIELETPAEDTPDILSRVEVLFAPLGYQVDRSKMDACPKLRVIGSNTTGHPHIDVGCATEKNVGVACLKFANEFLKTITPTAELTMGLMIALTRNVIPAHRAALQGTWDRRPFGGARMLSSMSLGIVGHGRLGSLVARYAKAFGMDVRYYDPFVPQSIEGATRMETLEALVACIDIVSIHVPHELETEKMFDAALFGRFKPGAYLVNTARGELIEWDALLDALESGQLAGAALDVFEDEFVPGFAERFPHHPLLEYARTHDNLVLTPHIGGSTFDAWSKTEGHTIDMILDCLRTSELPQEAP